MQKRNEIETKFNKCRSNLLVVIAFSAINVILTIINSGITFLFSAAFPKYSVEFGQLYSNELGNSVFFIVGIAVAFLAIAFYGICYLLSKRYKVFILVALVFFVIDTLFLLWFLTLGIDVSTIINIAFHIWVIYNLVIGVTAWSDLKKMPLDTYIEDTETQEDNQEDSNLKQTSESIPIRPQGKKGRVLISQNYNDLKIAVKRSFGTTELIVNGMVYAEKKGLVEINYTLDICVDHTLIKVTMDTSSIMCLYVNGNLLDKKRRIL